MRELINEFVQETTVRPLTLGELITKLEQQPQNNDVYFEFCHLAPTNFASWRGYYKHIALGYQIAYPSLKVSELLDKARSVVGQSYEGYKGGLYIMTTQTPVMVDNWRESTSTGLIDVIDIGDRSLLITKHMDDNALIL